MREAAERRQQLDEEHEQALAALTTKQQKIHLLHKAQVEAEREHEGAVHLLEAKVRDLEQKCRSQTKQFGQLSKSLEDFRLEADTVDIFSTEPFSKQKIPLSLENKLSQILNGLAVQAGKGNESSANTPLISKFLRPLQIGDRDRPELLSVNPTTVTTSCPSSPQRATPSEMEDEVSPAPRSKPRYTGTVRLCTARYRWDCSICHTTPGTAGSDRALVQGVMSVYNPYDGPNEHPEAELPLVAGKYLYVYGTMDDDGFYQGELLDGQRGLVPSNFVEFVQDKEKPSIQLGDGEEDLCSLDHITLGLMGVDGGAPRDGLLGSSNPLGPCSNGTGPLDTEDLVDDIVPYPRRITLIKQLARSVIVAWEPPMVPLGWGKVSCYNVLVDGEVRASIPYGDRTKSLLEKLDLDTYTHRVSVQSVTDRGLSDELRCTLMVGANVVVAPYGLRVDDILRNSAELSWLPSNSNYGHTVFLDGAEHAMVKPGRYRLRFVNLKAMTVYKVRVVARPHQVPWQLLMEQREKKEAAVEFCTQAAGPPLPPQEVQVQCGQAPGVLQVHWKPPILSPSGTSNGASVIGYAVCTKGQKIAEVLYPLADYVTVELTRIQCLEAREVIVRTLSAQGESQDSHVAPIPNNLLLPPPHPAPVPPQQPHAGPPPPHSHTPPPHLQSPHLPHPQLPPPHLQPPSPLPHRQPFPNHNPQTQPHLQPLLPHLVLQPHRQPQPAHPGGPPQPLHLQPHPPHTIPQHRLPLLPHPPPQLHQRPVSARDLEAKELVVQHGGVPSQPWDPTRSPSAQPPPAPMYGHTLEAPLSANHRSPSPQRILPQPRGTPIPDQMAKAIAREAAQRVAAESGRMERRVVYNDQCQAFHQQNSDEEEEDEEGYGHGRKRQGASVDEFLRGSELGRPVKTKLNRAHYSHSEEYHSDSSRGSDLSDIMEEDEEELYSEMQLEEGRRRNSHNALKIGNTPSGGRLDRETGRRMPRDGPQPQRHPLMAPSIEGYRDRERCSPTNYDESEPEESFRIFVALFDYDPLSMSPNPDAADEELPFKEGQIIRVYGDKDTDGFYRGEIRGGRMGLLPCNMVSEIRAEDEETMDQLIKQGFLPLNTPVDKVGIGQDRRGLCQHQATRRMVALYDYDPRESSPNVDVEAELTFCAGDILAVFGEIDEDGFYYGEINGHRGLVPSNFLEEVPDDVEVYLTDTPSRYAQDEPANRAEAKRVTTDTTESTAPPVRAASPMVRPVCPPGTMRPISPTRGPRDLRDNKKKKGLLSKGKKLLKRLSPVK
ncbi:RIMS-binding protein 2-like isoform X2 [Salvelinus alpinus]|uniref:RIMS-binding protein 2-like isoform X2 n=1 Tax=Salvelinus alpinus TaxID=8036 RepID=UPI0039FCBFF3